ncbi:MAG: hypothetical protein KAH38_07135 [Candidatus Hydrogenedentes bacterium]|nr:hypothetical protein [Candidatus Hydrogenedentota bacterium]
MYTRSIIFITAVSLAFFSIKISAQDTAVNLTGAGIVVSKTNTKLYNAAQMLQEEIERRGNGNISINKSETSGNFPVIIIGTIDDMPQNFAKPKEILVPNTSESYAVHSSVASGSASTLFLIGHDIRGVLYAAGWFLRKAHIEIDSMQLPGAVSFSASPRYPMRGHQLGFRNTANSYDAWNIDTFEQYIRDCIIFGTNSIELIPSLSVIAKDGPVMVVSRRSMNVKIAELLERYGLEVWLFLELSGHVENPKEWISELEARDQLFSAYPIIDHIMIPGGDPGHTAPNLLMSWLADLSPVLHNYFPNAGIWVSNQGFVSEENDTFFRYMKEKQPDWLTGVVFGPWAKLSIEELRKRTPAHYPIRRYPDITHCIRSQYPIPEWHSAFAQIAGREFTNPRPADMSIIHNLFASYANGFLAYSDGCHDDLNKMIWSALAWDPDADVHGIVEDYGRTFFGQAYAKDIAQGLWMLEGNWRGNPLRSTIIPKTLSLWLAIEARAGKELENNWRFKLYLLRALCDAYIREKLIVDTEQELRIYEALGQVDTEGILSVLENADAILNDEGTVRVHRDLRIRIEKLAIDLFELQGMQYSVYEPYRARNTERGAILDNIDLPLNNRFWLIKQLKEIRSMQDEGEQRTRINRLVNWESPRPGTLYDDLGHASKQSHLVRQTPWSRDPGFVHSPQEEHSSAQDKMSRTPGNRRLSWIDQAQTLFGTPLQMHYDELDPNISYTLRVTYAGRFRATMRLLADGIHEIHGPLVQPNPVWPIDFDIPREATSDGILDLEWQLVQARGCQVAEVWLIPGN